MSKMQYNVFVSSDVPDAAVPHEVDVDTTRDAFEKTGTLSYYASSSTTINQVANHYAFSVDLTGLVVGDMISMTRDGSSQFTGMNGPLTGHITSIVWHLPTSSNVGSFCFRLDTEHAAISSDTVNVTIKRHSPRVPRSMVVHLPHPMAVTEVELWCYQLSNMETTEKLKVGQHKSKGEYNEHQYYILEIDELRNLTQRSNVPQANNAFAVLPTGALNNLSETPGATHNVLNMLHEVQSLGRAHTMNKLTVSLLTPQGSTPRLHKCHLWLKLTVEEGLNNC